MSTDSLPLESLVIATVWHAGSNSFYETKLLRKISPEAALFHPEDVPSSEALRDFNPVNIRLETPQEKEEMRFLLNRALNCLDKPPQWAVDLSDRLNGLNPQDLARIPTR